VEFVNTGTVETEVPAVAEAVVSEEPAETPVVDQELSQALTDLAVAGRVLGNIVNAINVVLNRADTTGVAVVKSTPRVTTPTSTKPLSARDTEILNVLVRNSGSVVTKTQFRRALGGRTGDLTAAISRIRQSTGLRIESTQTIRANGEKVGKNVTGYRLTTDEQVRARDAANLLRNILSDVAGSIVS
jgi:DNA-binding winged helix-turn-helix (wHTH) protein